ncbi:hypothetical protein LB505_013404 [Fusarium chuoi]|nr:hypothetical protein LB505_013404 [Fusarium chuoi]
MDISKSSKSGIHGSGTLAKWRRRSLIPSTWETSVRFVNVNESAAAGSALAQAFATDAMSQYVLDGDDMADYSDEQKWKLHVDYMTYMVAAHCYKGMVTTIGSDYDAVALWYVNHDYDRNLILTASQACSGSADGRLVD